MTRGCQVLLELLASLLGAHGERGLLVATSPELWRSLSGLLEQPGRVLRCSVARFVRVLLAEAAEAAHADGGPLLRQGGPETVPGRVT